jgi:hypothetical protein
MSAFSLGSPIGGGGGLVYRGPVFVPGAQAAGSTQTGQATTLATQAFGITAGAPDGGPRTAHYGTIGATVLGVGLLLAIYFSLPR